MRKRLDILLVERGHFASREQAQRAILAGTVLVDGRLMDKPGQQVPEEALLELHGVAQPYVSRGGQKLAGALDAFGLAVAGRVCLDLGASTGGFTDCLLQRGAARVYAVDVGRGQLAWKLRQDPRVVVIEEFNARHLKPQDLPEPPDLITIDVSFISLGLILPGAVSVLAPAGEIVALVKPQFEAGRAQVGKHGVVRDPAAHARVLAGVVETAGGLGLGLQGLTHSPLRGPEGNIEFFAWWDRGAGMEVTGGMIQEVVEGAHRAFGLT
ncbi:MAG: TlyA family RNA methyltransferase [Bacteroidota bacterium]